MERNYKVNDEYRASDFVFDEHSSERAEFKGQIVDLFEDWLDENDYQFKNEERDEAIEDGDYEDESEAAHIWGDDYDKIADRVEQVLKTDVIDDDCIRSIVSEFTELCDRNDIPVTDDIRETFVNKVTDTFNKWEIPLFKK